MALLLYKGVYRSIKKRRSAIEDGTSLKVKTHREGAHQPAVFQGIGRKQFHIKILTVPLENYEAKDNKAEMLTLIMYEPVIISKGNRRISLKTSWNCKRNITPQVFSCSKGIGSLSV